MDALNVELPTSPARAAIVPERTRRLLEAPILPTLLRLAAPTIALMLFQAVVNATEGYFVGFLGAEALAGISLSFPLVMLMTTLSAGAYGGGVASAVARSLGAGKRDEAARLAGTSLSVAALLGAAFTTIMLIFGHRIYAMLGATGNALEAAARYSDVLFLGAIPFWIFQAAASCLRGSGNTNYPAIVGAVGGRYHASYFSAAYFRCGPIPRPWIGRGGLGGGRLQRGIRDVSLEGAAHTRLSISCCLRRPFAGSAPRRGNPPCGDP